MKLSVLEEFLNGAFWRIQEKPIPLSPEYKKEFKKASASLWNSCSDGQRLLFKDYETAVFGLQAEAEDFRFKSGFRYGLLLAMETIFMPPYDENDNV